MIENRQAPGNQTVTIFGLRQVDSAASYILARQQAIANALQSFGLAPEQIEAITPLAIMRLVMTARLKAGGSMPVH